MRITWEFGAKDVARVRAFLSQHEDDPFVKHRRKRNLGARQPIPSESRFWKAMIACLLTTQQRSGPGSVVSRFLREDPFPLAWEECLSHRSLEGYVRRTVSGRGLRRGNQIAEEVVFNMAAMRSEWWGETLAVLHELARAKAPAPERSAAQYIQAKLKGFGPKQSRNLLQTLGLTRFEIPLDSRIVKWLNDLAFPVPLSPSALSDESYYSFVMDAVQELCRACGIFPCILDAAVFSSFDRGKWREEDIIF